MTSSPSTHSTTGDENEPSDAPSSGEEYLKSLQIDNDDLNDSDYEEQAETHRAPRSRRHAKQPSQQRRRSDAQTSNPPRGRKRDRAHTNQSSHAPPPSRRQRTGLSARSRGRGSSAGEREGSAGLHSDPVASDADSSPRPGPAVDASMVKRYRRLLDEEIRVVESGVRWDDDADDDAVAGAGSGAERFTASTIGVVEWSGEEKVRLFDAVSRFGRDDLPRIAAAVGKSMPEVHQMILLLDDGLREKMVREPKSVPACWRVPAAAEIPEEVEKRLDELAARLERMVGAREGRKEREEWGDKWVLGREAVEEIEAAIGKGEQNISVEEPNLKHKVEEDTGEGKGDEILDQVPSACLLNLAKFLDLSQKVFMNSTDPDRDWRTHAAEGETPAIRQSAFHEFHTIAISLTTRVASIAMFQAMTRIRSRRAHKHNNPKNYVRPGDVLTALDILNLKSDAWDFWAGLAQRTDLKWVVEGRGQVSSDNQRPVRVLRKIKAVKAERLLRQPTAKKYFTGGDGLGGPASENEWDEGEKSEEAMSVDASSASAHSESGEDFQDLHSDDSSDSEQGEQLSHSESEHDSVPQSNPDDEDEYLIQEDLETDAAETKRRCELLELPIPQSVRRGKRSQSQRKFQGTHHEHMPDWRNSIEDKAVWEIFSFTQPSQTSSRGPVSQKVFYKKRTRSESRGRRKRRREATLEDSAVESPASAGTSDEGSSVMDIEY